LLMVLVALLSLPALSNRSIQEATHDATTTNTTDTTNTPDDTPPTETTDENTTTATPQGASK
ncbi:hypothetical protein, partial [Streptomyces sp. NPDC005244]|uniref:hypothetical protein n=1 Tax=Streptomyces sp. NPDC005244 TaxID=3364708 RepID=UPI00367F1DA3